MKAGKVADTILDRSVFKLIGRRGTAWKERPACGQDAAHIDSRGKYTVVSTECGEWSVYRVANNISAAGGVIDAVSCAVIMDERSREIRLKEITRELDRQCAMLDIPIVGGHTTVSGDVNKPVVSVTGIGHADIKRGKAMPGQDIVMTGYIGVGGIRRIAGLKSEEILKMYSEDFLDRAVGSESELISVKVADICAKSGMCGIMHDVSEGGVMAALWDMAEYSGVGLDIDMRSIPVRQEIIEICEMFNINPYVLDSVGCLLMTCESGCGIVEIVHDNGVPAAVIGKVTDGSSRILRNRDEERFLELPQQDEIYRLCE